MLSLIDVGVSVKPIWCPAVRSNGFPFMVYIVLCETFHIGFYLPTFFVCGDMVYSSGDIRGSWFTTKQALILSMLFSLRCSLGKVLQGLKHFRLLVPCTTMKANESRKARGRVKWDEENLNDIESTKPVREKITEPKTPFHPTIDEDEEGCIKESVDKSFHADAITTALMEAVSSGKFSARDNWESSGNEEEAINQGNEFEEHRKAHYDEYRKVKEHHQKGTLSGETDEDVNSETPISKQPTC